MDRTRFVLAARAQGVSLDVAERRAAELYGADKRDACIREKEEQAAIVKLFRAHGFTVRSTSQARPSKVAIGLPDLWVTHKTRPLAFWFETKRQVGGVLSEAQAEFAADCERCGVKCWHGDRYHAQEIIDLLGIPR